MGYCVYILYSPSADSFYKGQTADLKDRICRHNHGYEKATLHGRPWKILWTTSKNTKAEAVRLEKKLKNLSRERLIRFIFSHSEGIADPDALLLLEKGTGCIP
ncbi:MAG: GIY-YIG nuclease family protein [Bacteroidales bacterium]